MPRLLLAAVGAAAYAVAGGLIGAQNAGWIERSDANALLPILGLGAALVALALRSTSFHRELVRSAIGRAGGRLVVLGSLVYVASWLVEFAILGTLTVAAGLACLSLTFWVVRLGTVADRIIATLAAVFSLTWNTETTSAFLLVGVALCWIVLATRLLRSVDS